MQRRAPGCGTEMTRLADTGTQTAAMPRSEAYIRAGEQWLLADDPAAAVNGFMRAIADGGRASVDPRIPLARALFQLGRNAEAEDHISGVWRRTCPATRGCATCLCRDRRLAA